MWRVVGLACAALLMAPCASARAATDGMLAAVLHGTSDRLVTFNADGTGVRTVWTAPDALSAPVWAPDGNRLALVAGGRIVVVDVASGQARAVTDGQDPGWSADGSRIYFLRGRQAGSVAADGSDPRALALGIPAPVDAAAWAPDGSLAFRLGGRLLVADGAVIRTLLGASPAGGLAWGPDAIAFQDGAGTLEVIGLDGGAPAAVTTPSDAPDEQPAFAPDGALLAYIHGEELRTVASAGGTPRTLLRGPDQPAAPAWQPCVTGVTRSCVSVASAAAPPAPSCQPLSVTTQAGRPVDLPAPSCSDPGGHALTTIVVRPPEHGTLSGRRYTPADGFTGQDSLLFTASNGESEAPVTQLTIFVVPRPAAAAPAAAVPARAPFLSATAPPALDRAQRVSLRATCDQPCTVRLRLRVRAGRRTIYGPYVTRSGTAFALRMKLRRRVHAIKTAWITGTVRNARARRVKLPVALPR